LRTGIDDFVSKPAAAAADGAQPTQGVLRLFGQGDTAAEREAIILQASSLLDLVSESSASVAKPLGATDRARLDDYQSSVREIERRVQIMSDQDFSSFDLPMRRRVCRRPSTTTSN
jgi:hypothetical protein